MSMGTKTLVNLGKKTSELSIKLKYARTGNSLVNVPSKTTALSLMVLMNFKRSLTYLRIIKLSFARGSMRNYIVPMVQDASSSIPITTTDTITRNQSELSPGLNLKSLTKLQSMTSMLLWSLKKSSNLFQLTKI